ncbi:hypothetical protein [Streptomyces sp. NBC_00989]|uniref:hypothetical protein n=1 Tax=Streptomyces sp. NBC_00989 TaxID=2903705 RepID=UPI00386B28ED|nr:DUF4351 domain-containing protein [Streptomyces sp. NBC_00989]
MGFVNYFPGRGHLMERAYLEGQAEGKAEGEAALILRLLEKRGILVSEDTQERVTSCTDLDTLTLWFDRALTVTVAEDLFAVGAADGVDGADASAPGSQASTP